MRPSDKQPSVLRYLVYFVIILALGGFCYYAFTDINIEQSTAAVQIPNERFY